MADVSLARVAAEPVVELGVHPFRALLHLPTWADRRRPCRDSSLEMVRIARKPG